jgi:hypothetical protein
VSCHLNASSALPPGFELPVLIGQEFKSWSGNGSKERNPPPPGGPVLPTIHPMDNRYTDYVTQALCHNVLSFTCIKKYARKVCVANILLRVCESMNEKVNLVYSASSVER